MKRENQRLNPLIYQKHSLSEETVTIGEHFLLELSLTPSNSLGSMADLIKYPF